MTKCNQDPRTRPQIQVSVQGTTSAKALYDTGATVSVMSERTFMNIPQRDRPTMSKYAPLRLTGADNKAMTVRGSFDMNIRILERTIRQEIHVVDGLTSDLMMGCDLIHTHGLGYNAIGRKPYYQDRRNWEEGRII